MLLQRVFKGVGEGIDDSSRPYKRMREFMCFCE